MFPFAERICVFALAALCLQGALHAQTTTPPAQVTRTSGIVGLAEGQTAELNALNPGVVPPAMGSVCSAMLSIVASDGTVLKSKLVNVAPGASQSLTLDSVKDLSLSAAERKQIRATILIPPVPPAATSSTTPEPPACKLIGTLEIFNTLDGHTQVTLGTTHLVPSPVATPAN